MPDREDLVELVAQAIHKDECPGWPCSYRDEHAAAARSAVAALESAGALLPEGGEQYKRQRDDALATAKRRLAGMVRRFDQCGTDCTADCGHCKGDPVGALRTRLAEVGAERDEARAAIRRAQAAIRNGAQTAGAVALALVEIGDYGGPSTLDERDEARAERDAMRPVVEAAVEWHCPRCHSTRWVSASLTGPVGYGGRAIKQCVPCGHYSAVDTYTTQEATRG